MSQANSEFRVDINALRAVAVISVVAFHLRVPGFSGGFSGVDVFFVISGYLISSQILGALRRGDFSFGQFYASRLRRIVPALVVVCMACFAFGWFVDLPKEFIQLSRHIVSALFFVSNIAFNGERGYFDAAAETKSLLHTWSLSVEGQFYLFLPLVLIALYRFAPRYITTAVLGLAALSFAWALFVDYRQPGGGFYLLLCRAWEFLVGTWLASLSTDSRTHRRAANLAVAVGLLGLLASSTWLSVPDAWPGWRTLIPVASTALVIYYGRAACLQPLFAWAPLQFLGNVSYSLYLWHWPFWVFALALASAAGRTHGVFDQVVVLTLSLVTAWLSWKYVEQPVRINRVFWTSKRIAWSYAAAVSASLGVGIFVLVNMGLPTRFGEYVLRAAEATFISTPRDECFRRGDSTKDAPEQFCRMGANAGVPSVILWGDSHANQYLTAVSDAARELGKGGLIATQSGCAPALVLEVSSSSSSCQRFNHEVLTYLASHPEIDIAVLGKWWGGGGDVEPPLALVNHLLERGLKVVLIGPLPSPGFDVPDRWSRQQMRAGHAIDEITVPLTSQAESFGTAAVLRSRLAGPIKAHRLVLIDPLSKLCDETQCWLVQNGRSNFRDESHLSHSASMQFTGDIASALKQLSQ